MPGQMCWLSSSNTEGQLILHLRERFFDAWLPYTAFLHHRVPDSLIPGESKGWNTYQKLRQAGWTLIPTAQAQNTFRRVEVPQVQNS